VTLQSLDTGVVVGGQVPTGADAENVRRIAARFIGENQDLINRLQVTEPNQVNLRVRVAEIARSVIRQLGIDWATAYSNGPFAFGVATQQFAQKALQFGSVAQQAEAGFFSFHGADFDLDAIIDALAEEDLVSVLAEPNLTAISGETASFLAGGEFPVPVAQDTSATGDSTITVQFKSFGVSLAFTPTLLGGNRINMRVRPEVSALSTEGAVQISGFNIPALTVRQAETTIELASGQSFAIAGLIQNNARFDADHIPGLGSLPILGELFRSNRFRRDETELVIIVTPYIVQPVSNPQLLASPTDATMAPQGTQRLSAGPGGAPVPPAAGGPAGPVGFVIE
jgi:pilus assembly protein CpaC